MNSPLMNVKSPKVASIFFQPLGALVHEILLSKYNHPSLSNVKCQLILLNVTQLTELDSKNLRSNAWSQVFSLVQDGEE